MSGYPKYDTELIIAAISGSGGVIREIADRLNVNRVTVWRWSKENSEIAEAIQEELESTLDTAETKLIELINEKDGASVRFFLATKGRHRGYAKKIEMEGQLNHSGQVQIYLPDNGRAVGDGGS